MKETQLKIRNTHTQLSMQKEYLPEAQNDKMVGVIGSTADWMGLGILAVILIAAVMGLKKKRK